MEVNLIDEVKEIFDNLQQLINLVTECRTVLIGRAVQVDDLLNDLTSSRRTLDGREEELRSRINQLFCVAVQNSDSNLINLVMERSAEINFSSKRPHNTFLHLAVMKQHVETVKKLLARGNDITEENYLRQNPFDIAVKLRSNEILSLLIEHVSKENITESVYFKLLNDLLENDYKELAEKLLSKDVGILGNYLTYFPNFFWIAVEKGFCKVVKKMIDREVDVNFIISDDWGSSKTALHISCQKGDHKMVKLLLDNGASGSFEKYCRFEKKYPLLSPLQTAIAFGKTRIVEMFLDHGFNVNSLSQFSKSKTSMLHVAARFNQVEIIKVLLKRGIDINIKDEEGCQAIVDSRNSGKSRAFHYIINHKDFTLEFTTVNCILKNSLEVHPNNSRHILNHAKKFGSQQLNHEIDEKIINNPSYDSLLTRIAHEAWMTDSVDVIFEYSAADVNIRNQSGRTVIFVALLRKNTSMITKFLKYGADINIKCNRGLTPLDYALMEKVPDEIYKEGDIKDYDQFKGDVGSINEFIEQISQHLVKMKLLNLYVNENDFQRVLSRATDPYRHQKKYQKEIAKMKETIINRDVSYYDIVKVDLNTMVVYLQDDVILQALQSKSYKSRFPKFKIIISGCFYRGLVRKNLLDQVSRFTVFDMIFKFPYSCMCRIMDNFSNSDLRRVIYSYRHLM